MYKNTKIVRAIAMIASAIMFSSALAGCADQEDYLSEKVASPYEASFSFEDSEAPAEETAEAAVALVATDAVEVITEVAAPAEDEERSVEAVPTVLRETTPPATTDVHADVIPAATTTYTTVIATRPTTTTESRTETTCNTEATELSTTATFKDSSCYLEKKFLEAGMPADFNGVCFISHEAMEITAERSSDGATTVNGKDWSFIVLERDRYEQLAHESLPRNYRLVYFDPEAERWVIAWNEVPGEFCQDALSLPIAVASLNAGETATYCGVEFVADEAINYKVTQYDGIEATLYGDGWTLKFVNAAKANAYESPASGYDRIRTQVCKFDFTPIAVYAKGNPPVSFSADEELVANEWLTLKEGGIADFHDAISFRANSYGVWHIEGTPRKTIATSGYKTFIIVDAAHVETCTGMQYHMIYSGPNCRDPEWYVYQHGDESVDGSFGSIYDYHRDAADECDLLADLFYGNTATFCSEGREDGRDPFEWNYVSFGGLSYDNGLYTLQANSVWTDWDLEIVWDASADGNFTQNHAVLDYERAYSTLCASKDVTADAIVRMQNERWLVEMQTVDDATLSIFVMDKWCENHCVSKHYSIAPLSGSIMIIARTEEFDSVYNKWYRVSRAMSLDFRLVHLMNIVARDTQFRECFE